MPPVLQILALLCLVFGMLLLLAAYRLNTTVRPTGHVDYVDTEQEDYIPHGPLIAEKGTLAGQPHGLLRLLHEGQTVPILVADAPAPADAPDSPRRYQMAMFCRLAEMVYDQPVSYGIIRYEDVDFPISWTPELSADLDQLLTAMQADLSATDVPRSHDDPAVCRACRVRSACTQALE